MCTHLYEELMTIHQQCLGCLFKMHRLPQITTPVLGIELGRIHPLTHYGRIEGDSSRARCKLHKHALKLLTECVYMLRVGSVINSNLTHPNAFSLVFRQ